MGNHLIQAPRTLPSNHIERRPCVENSGPTISTAGYNHILKNLLWKPQIHMLGPFRVLVQVTVESRLLDHSSMKSVPRCPSFLVVRIAIDELRQSCHLPILVGSRDRVDSYRDRNCGKKNVELGLQHRQHVSNSRFRMDSLLTTLPWVPHGGRDQRRDQMRIVVYFERQLQEGAQQPGLPFAEVQA
jgi:hypothetical protein